MYRAYDPKESKRNIVLGWHGHILVALHAEKKSCSHFIYQHESFATRYAFHSQVLCSRQITENAVLLSPVHRRSFYGCFVRLNLIIRK